MFKFGNKVLVEKPFIILMIRLFVSTSYLLYLLVLEPLEALLDPFDPLAVEVLLPLDLLLE